MLSDINLEFCTNEKEIANDDEQEQCCDPSVGVERVRKSTIHWMDSSHIRCPKFSVPSKSIAANKTDVANMMR